MARGHGVFAARVSRRVPVSHVCRQRGDAARARTQAVRRHRHGESFRGYIVRHRRDAHRLHRMLPSASLNASSAGLYEPVHGSAPDIAGEDKANPLATILSAAMLMRYSLDESEAANDIERAVADVLSAGKRTGDIATNEAEEAVIGTRAMGDAVVSALSYEGE